MTDFTAIDYFGDESVAVDTYPYFDFLLDGGGCGASRTTAWSWWPHLPGSAPDEGRGAGGHHQQDYIRF